MFCYFMQVDGVSALIVQSALSKLVSGRCYHAVSLENLHTIDITRYLVSQGYKMDPVDYGWWMDRVKSLATSAMQPLLNTFAALPVKETKGQVMRFSSDMPHRNGSGLAQLERMVRWCARRASSPGFSTRPAACRCRAAPRRRRTPPRPRPRSACPRCSPSRWRRPPRSLRPCRPPCRARAPGMRVSMPSRSTPRITAWTSRRWSSTTAALASTLLVCPSEFFFLFFFWKSDA